MIFLVFETKHKNFPGKYRKRAEEEKTNLRLWLLTINYKTKEPILWMGLYRQTSCLYFIGYIMPKHGWLC